MIDETDIFAKSALRRKRQRKQSAEPRRFLCSQCGSAVAYAIDKTQIRCQSCGHSEDIQTATLPPIKERDLNDALASVRFRPLDAPETQVACQTCGAVSTWQAHQLADICPYCQTPMAKYDDENDRLKIEAIIPFTITQSVARQKLTAWFGNRWFAPNVLKHMAGHSKQLSGVYVPHWTFDSLTYTDYSGMRGDYYTEYVTQTQIVDGKTVTKRVPIVKTRWRNASGRVRVLFDDVLVLASMRLPQTIVNQLRPWRLQAAEPYTADYVAGLKADYYQLDLSEAFQVAKQQMNVEIDSAIRFDIGGNEQRIHYKNTQYQNSTYKLLMLPVWYSAFEYRGKLYRIVINGQTGKVAGHYPKSPIKIAVAVIVVLAIVALGLYKARLV